MDKRNVANKAYLVEPIVRHRVQDSLFYKQHLHLTNEKSLLQVIVDHVKYIGGTDSSNRPSPFLCCLVRLLELEPSEEIVELYLTQNGYNEFKYLTSLTLLYCRMVLREGKFYLIYDRYIKDYRRLRVSIKVPDFVNGRPIHYRIKHFDEWADELVENERVVDIKLPYLAPRLIYAERGEATLRTYDVESDEESEEEDSYVSDSD